MRRFLRRRSFYLVLPIIIAGPIIAVGLRTLTPTFTARAVVAVEPDRTHRTADPRAIQPRGPRHADWLAAQVRATIRSPELLAGVIANLRLQDEPGLVHEAAGSLQAHPTGESAAQAASELLIERLARKVRVHGFGDELCTIGVQDNDASTATALAAAILVRLRSAPLRGEHGEPLQVRVIEPVRTPGSSAGARALIVGALALALALFLGLCAALIAEGADATLRDARDAAALFGTEVLGILPRFGPALAPTPTERRRRTAAHCLFAAVLAAALVGFLLAAEHLGIRDRVSLTNGPPRPETVPVESP